jgi:hypothetical protein
MPRFFTGPDAVLPFSTGVTTHGGSAVDPADSRGRYRSGFLARSLSVLTDNGIAGLTVNFASGANTPGVGTIEALSSTTLRYTAPGGSPGQVATFPASGTSTRLLIDGSNPSAYLRVTRIGSGAFSGAMSVELSEQYGNVWSHSPVTSAERTAGLVQYRLVALANQSASLVAVHDLSAYVRRVDGSAVLGPSVFSTVLPSSGAGTIALSSGSFETWPAAGWVLIEEGSGTAREVAYYASRTATALTVPSAGRGLCGTSASAGSTGDRVVAWPGLALAWEEPSAQPSGHYNANSLATPSGLTWFHAREAGVEVFGDLPHGHQVGLWMRWDVPAGAVATPAPPLHRVAWAWEGV